MAKTKKHKAIAKKYRNPLALDAKHRRAGPMKDKRKQSRQEEKLDVRDLTNPITLQEFLD